MAQRRQDPSGSPAERHRGVLARATGELVAADTLRRYAELFQSSSDAIFTTTPEGAIVSWNPAAERLYGHRAAAVNGPPFRLLVTPQRPGQLPPALADAPTGGRPSP